MKARAGTLQVMVDDGEVEIGEHRTRTGWNEATKNQREFGIII